MIEMARGLEQARILIVEDEPFIAGDLVHAVELAGGEAIGPAASLKQALALIAEARGTIQAAILDVNLVDGHIGPVLDVLVPIVPVIVHTGVGLPRDVQGRFPQVPIYTKPTPSLILTAALAEMLAEARSQELDPDNSA